MPSKLPTIGFIWRATWPTLTLINFFLRSFSMYTSVRLHWPKWIPSTPWLRMWMTLSSMFMQIMRRKMMAMLPNLLHPISLHHLQLYQKCGLWVPRTLHKSCTTSWLGWLRASMKTWSWLKSEYCQARHIADKLKHTGDETGGGRHIKNGKSVQKLAEKYWMRAIESRAKEQVVCVVFEFGLACLTFWVLNVFAIESMWGEAAES